MKRMYVNLTDAQIATLKARAEQHGSPVAEVIRRDVAQANQFWDTAVSRGWAGTQKAAE
jgi:hypothetical protein